MRNNVDDDALSNIADADNPLAVGVSSWVTWTTDHRSRVKPAAGSCERKKNSESFPGQRVTKEYCTGEARHLQQIAAGFNTSKGSAA